MNKLIKIFTLKICAILFFIFSLSGCEFNKKSVEVNKEAKADFTLEWHEITLETFPKQKETLEGLMSVFVDSFLPIIKLDALKKDALKKLEERNPVFAKLPAEIKEQKVVEGITKTLQSQWDKKIKQLYADLKSKHLPIAYVVIAKDNQKNLIGFALLKEAIIKDFVIQDSLDKNIKSIVEGNKYLNDTTHDQIYVSLLFVRPGTQNKGVGRALVFSVFDHRQDIKKIYLRAVAGDSNKKTQGFYEHVGFIPVYTGAFKPEEGDASGFASEKIVYMYKKEDKK